MAELKCTNCGTAYDTDGFEPGQRFRCHGDGCSEKLTVPDANAPAPSVSETPTPAPVVKAAAPVSNYGDDEDVLEAKEPSPAAPRKGGKGKGKKRRGGTGRRSAPPPPEEGRGGGGRRGNVQAPPSQAPMFAAIGGVALLLVIVAIVMLQAPVDPKGGKKAKPKARFKASDPVDYVKKGGDDGGDDSTETAVEAEEKPKPVKKPRKSKYDFTFVQDEGFQSTFQKYLKQMYHDDPNIAQDAEQALYDAGNKEQLCSTILNHLPKMDFTKLEDRTVASFLMNIVGDALGDDAKVAVGDDVVVTPNMNGKIGYQDASRAWRAYWRDNGGKLVPGK